jgi:hormone-sensitive lipase
VRKIISLSRITISCIFSNEVTTLTAPKLRGRLGSRTLSEDNIVMDIGLDALSVQSLHEKFQQATSSFVNAITSPFRAAPGDVQLKQRGDLIPPAPDDEFVFSVPKNQYLSPYWASDETLKQFPPTKILTIIVDPCLDDCVEFSKKLKHLNVDIHVDILQGLAHGFLNFAQVCCDFKASLSYC